MLARVVLSSLLFSARQVNSFFTPRQVNSLFTPRSITAGPRSAATVDEAAERADAAASPPAAASGEAKPSSLFGFELFFCYGCTSEGT